MVTWWSCVEGEMRSSKIDSETGSDEAGDVEDISRGESGESGSSESGGGTGSAMRR
jgi:hypothetical protein